MIRFNDGNKESTVTEDDAIKGLYNTLVSTTCEADVENNCINITSGNNTLWSYTFDNGKEFGKFFKRFTRVLSGHPEGPYGPYIPYDEG